MTTSWCERCAHLDRARYGSREDAPPEWGTLCGLCRAELASIAELEQRTEHERRLAQPDSNDRVTKRSPHRFTYRRRKNYWL